MAKGLGIQILRNGEKYKGPPLPRSLPRSHWMIGALPLGYFDNNLRHGKGACSYRNGSRYVGNWYRCVRTCLVSVSLFLAVLIGSFRGCAEGFGIYVSPIGEKYVGNWAANKKHGVGE